MNEQQTIELETQLQKFYNGGFDNVTRSNIGKKSTSNIFNLIFFLISKKSLFTNNIVESITVYIFYL